MNEREVQAAAVLSERPPVRYCRWNRSARGLARQLAKLQFGCQLLRRLTAVAFALGLFILSLQLMKRGATGLTPVLDKLTVHTAVNYLGFGWLSAYALGSGSPVASVALTLFSRGVLSETQTYFMISGGRLGASFIVLLVGFVYYVRGRREPDGLYIGAVALMTTAAIYSVGIPFGYALLRSGWLDGVRFGSPGLIKGVNEAYKPAVDFFDSFLPLLGLFVVGVAVVVVSLKMFDAALPSLESTNPRFQRVVEFFHQKLTMFVLGIAITVLTVSVAVSLTILVPLSMKGIVRRQQHHPVRDGRADRHVRRQAVRHAPARLAARVHDHLQRDARRPDGLAFRVDLRVRPLP